MESEIEADVQFHELTVIRIGINSRIWSNHFLFRGEGVCEVQGVLEVVVGGVSTCHTSKFVSYSNLTHLFEWDCLTKIGHIGFFEGGIKGIRKMSF